MKSSNPSRKQSSRSSRALIGSIAALLAAHSPQAANYFWDIDGVTADAGGATPSGIWGTLGTTWSTDPTGSALTPGYTTLGIDDLFFSAGTNATGTYTVTLGANQNAKSLTFQEGTNVVVTANTITLAGGGGITVDTTSTTGATISSGLTINGNNTFNIGSGETLTLNTGTFTRGTRATLNVQGLGTVTSTQTGLATAGMVNGIIGPWASIGTGATTRYATFTGNNITALTGTAAATAANVTSTLGTFNYDVAAAGTLGAGASVNTLRYTGAAGTIAGGLTTKGIMNVGGGLLTFTGAVTSGAAATELVINTANGDITMSGAGGILTGTITKTGAGTMTMTAQAHSIGGITVNEGVLITNHSVGDGITGTAVAINSGGTLKFGGSNKHVNSSLFTVNAGGGFDLNSFSDTIGAIAGAGSITTTSGTPTLILSSGTQTFSGVISGTLALTLSNAAAVQTLSGQNTYTRGTTITAGTLILGNTNALGTSPGVNGTSGISIASTGILQANPNGTTIVAPITLSGVGDATLRVGLATASTFNVNGGIGGTTGNLVFSTDAASHANAVSTFVLGAAGTYAGNTLITTGNGGNNPVTVRAGVGIVNALPVTTVLSFAGVAGGGTGRVFTYDMNGNAQTLAGLTNTVASLRRSFFTNSGALATLTINNTTDMSFGGSDLTTGSTNRTQITGNIALTKSGAGTFTLGGTLLGGATAGGNTFTGDTKVLGGILNLGETLSLQSSTFDTANSILGDGTNGLRTTVTTLTLGGLSGNKNFADVFTTALGGTGGVTTRGGYDGLTALTLNPTATLSYPGNIAEGAAGMNLTKGGAGALTLSGNLTYTGATTLSTGTLTLTGVNTYAGATTIGGTILNANSTDALGSASNTLVFTGGTLQAGGTITSPSTRLVTLTSTGLIDTNSNAVSIAGIMSGAGGVTKSGLGTLTLTGSSTYTGATTIGVGTLNANSTTALGDGSASNTLVFTGGTLQAANTITSPSTRAVVLTSTGVIDTNNNAVSIAGIMGGAGGVTKSGLGTLTLTGSNAYTGATTIGAGTLSANSTDALGDGTNASNTLIFTGGTLQAGGTIVSPSTRLVALTNTGLIDTNGNAVAIAGIMSGAGGLTKSGLGTLSLAASNAYTGATLVSGGTLSLTGTGDVNTSSGITVNGSGAQFLQASSVAVTPTVTLTQGTLTGSGTVNTVNVGASTGGIVSNNNGVSGAALTIGTLTLAGGANLNLFSGSTAADLIVTTLTNNSAASAVTITANNVGGWANGSTYNLISYTTLNGTGLNNFAQVVNNLATRQGATWGDTGSAITLTIAGDNPVWSGANGGIWITDITNSATSGTPNWALKTGHSTTDFWAGDNVEFNDTVNLGAGPVAPTTTTVNISTADVSPVAATFNNSTLDYTLNGGFGIAAGSLSKTGTGTLTINTANAYSGATNVSGGTVVLAGSLTGGTAITISGSAVLSESAAGVISGAASLAHSSSGTSTLAGTNSYTGTTTVSAGTLALTGSLTGGTAITISGTGVLSESAAGVISGAASLSHSSSGTSTLAGVNSYSGATNVSAGTLNLTGSLTGGTAITISGTGVFSESAASVISGGASVTHTSSGTSTLAGINTYTGTTTLDGGIVNANSTDALGDGSATNTLIFTGGTLQAGGTITSPVTRTVSLVSTGLIDTNGNAVSIAGIMGGPGGVTKSGLGTLTLSGSSNYTGATTIGAGTLNVNSTTALGNGSATNTLIFAGGSLLVSGTITSPSTRTVNLSSTGVIDTNTFDASFAGAVSGAGGLTKDGTGKLTFSALNSFSGPITINGGTLEFSASATGALYASTQININGASILRITGTAGNQTIYDGRNYTFDATGGGSILVSTGNYNAASTPFSITTNGGARDTIGLITTSGTFGFNLGTTTGTFNVALGSDATSDLTVTPIVANTGSIVKTGAGRLTLSGANTYSGTTTIANGTLIVNATAGLGNSAATNTLIFTGGTLKAGGAITSVAARTVTLTSTGLIDTNNFAVSIAGIASGAGGLTKLGLGTLTLSGANTFGGDLSVAAGAVTSTATSDSVFGAGTIIFNTGGAVDATVQSGNSASARNFANPITVMAGSTGINTLGATTNTTTFSGLITADESLTITSGNANTFTVFGGGASVANGKTITLQNTSTGTLTATGVVTGAGGVATAGAGVGSIVITGASTYTGGFTLGGSSSVILSTSSTGADGNPTDGPFGAGTTASTLGTGTIRATTGGDITIKNVLTLAGNVTASTLASEKSLIFTAPATLTGTRTFTVNLGATDATKSLTFQGNIGESGGAQGLTKAGTGIMILSGSNDYSGLTTVSGGTLRVQSAGALGTSALGTTVNGTNTGAASTARLELNGGVTVTGEALTISGFGNFLGALTSFTGSNEWAGNVTIGLAGTRIGASAGASLTISGVIDSGAVNTGLSIRTSGPTGIVVLSGASTYLGDTQLLIGKLQLAGGDNRLPVATKFGIGNGVNVVEFDLNGRNQEIAGLSVLSGATAANNSVNNSSGTLSTLTVNTAAASPSTFTGILKGNLALAKTGADTLTITGANTYTGATTVSAGTLQVSGSSAIANAGLVTLADAAGATFQVVGSETIGALSGGGATGGAVSIDATKTLSLSSGTQTYAGTISGSGVLTNSGAIQTLNGALSHSGGVNVTAGVLTIGGSGNTYTGGTTVSDGTLVVNGSISGSTSVNSGGTLGGSGGTTGDVTVAIGGTIAPGSSIGTLNTGTLAFTGGAFDLEINTTAITSDLANVTGNLNLLSGATLNISDLDVSGTPLTIGQIFTFIDYSGTWDAGIFAGYADDSRFTLGLNEYRISYDGVNNATSAVTLEVVPEPGSVVLLLGGIAALAGFRRRRA